jgi:hypothetical protein
MLIDDRQENVLAARSCGITGLVYDMKAPFDIISRALKNVVLDPVARGTSYLNARKGHLTTLIEDGSELAENFAQLLILEVTGDSLSFFLV